MIKFFRKIRQNLLYQGKIGKYLSYAIGEIILVVIGILIALSINNWNEKKQVLSGMENNFPNLIEDLERNKLELLNLITIRENTSKGAGYLIDSYEKKIQVNENDFINKLYPILSERYFEINRNGIDKVINSPAFELDPLNTLRELIKSYLRVAKSLETLETKENAAIETMEMATAGNGYFRSVWKNLRKKRHESTSFNNPDFNFLEIMDNDELLYLVFRYENATPTAIDKYHVLIKKGDELLKAIEEYQTSK